MNLSNKLFTIGLMVSVFSSAGAATQGLGFVAPTVTSETDVVNPQEGEIVFTDDTGTDLKVYNGATWDSLTGGSSNASALVGGRGNHIKAGFAVVNCAASSTETSDPDSMISAVGNVVSGACSLTFTTGYFSSTPICVAQRNTAGGNTGRIISSSATSATAGSVFCLAHDGTNCSSGDAITVACFGNE